MGDVKGGLCCDVSIYPIGTLISLASTLCSLAAPQGTEKKGKSFCVWKCVAALLSARIDMSLSPSSYPIQILQRLERHSQITISNTNSSPIIINVLSVLSTTYLQLSVNSWRYSTRIPNNGTIAKLSLATDISPSFQQVLFTVCYWSSLYTILSPPFIPVLEKKWVFSHVNNFLSASTIPYQLGMSIINTY